MWLRPSDTRATGKRMAAPELQLPDIEEALKEIIEPYRLGMYLGIKEEDLKIIEANYPKRERQKNEIISYWKRNFNDCSWKALAKAVEKMGGHANLVKELMARGDQELNDTSQISEQESDSTQVEVINSDTTSKSASAQFQLNLSGRLNDRPRTKELRDHVQKKIGDRWEEVAVELGLDDDDDDSGTGGKKTTLDGIREERKDNPNMAAHSVLTSWLRSTRIKPTWGGLIEALRGAGLQEVVESVTTYLSVSCQNSPSTSGTTQVATAATAATQSTGTKQVLTEQNLETMDTSTPQDSSSQLLPCSTKLQYEVSKQPREYQKELAEPGIRGQNYIICAPTNSGKTLVAAMVIANHLEEKSQMPQQKPKVAFVVETLALADQQTQHLSDYIRNAHVERRTGNRGEDHRQQLHIKDALHDGITNIIVCTSGKLLDELKKEEISLLQFSLMIIDECHSTECSKQFSNAASAQIMRKYLELKEAAEKGPLPQVIGLTATPGMGKNPGLDSAAVVEYLIMLCAHMDATGGIQTVRQHKEELSRYVQNPESHLDTVDQNERKEICRIERDMEKCEKFLTFSCPFPRWSQQYEHAVKQQRNALEGSGNTEDRDKVSSVRLLDHYSQTLIKYTELPCALATEYLEQQSDLIESDKQSDHEKHLLESFTRLKDDIKSLQVSENPVLKKLELRLASVFQKKPESSGIVFVRTREQAEAICDWISDSEFANNVGIKARMLVGKTTLTGDEQKEVTDAFRNRDCNVIVATSVAEEGIDIKECNLIIRLHISGARSQAQMRGRARAENSEIITIVANDPKKAYKDMANNMLIELTNYLVEMQCLPPTQQLQVEITHRQRAIMEKAREQRMLEKLCKARHPAQDVELKCSKCKITACRGSDIYCIDKTNHHVVPGGEFTALYEKINHHSRGILLGCDNPIIMKDYKIHCLKCNQSWGVLGTWPSGLPYPIIKCENFIFNVNGNVKRFKKWKDRPFNVPWLSEWFTQKSAPATC